MTTAKVQAKPRAALAEDGETPLLIPRPKQTRDPENTKRRILKAAVQEFCELGFHGARMDNIAMRAKANKRLIYAYIGSKEELYLAILEEAYRAIRSEEYMLNLEQLPPKEGMEALTRFTFQHFLRHPEFVRLLIGENLQEARFLRKLRNIPAMHSPLIEQIRNLLTRGEAEGVFRRGIDPVQLYISIAALGFFYLSNRHTLSTIFNVDLTAPERLQAREDHIADVVLHALLSD